VQVTIRLNEAGEGIRLKGKEAYCCQLPMKTVFFLEITDSYWAKVYSTFDPLGCEPKDHEPARDLVTVQTHERDLMGSSPVSWVSRIRAK